MKHIVFLMSLLLLACVIMTGKAYSGEIQTLPNDRVIIGDPKTSNNRLIEFRGLNNKIRANQSNSKIEFTNDGSLWKAIGSGSGAGADAINVLLNPNAEDLLANWTYTGAGSFVNVSALADRIDGEQSFRVDFSAQNETLKSDEVTIPKGLYGKPCEARIAYYGGDDKIDLEVYNGNDTLLKSQTLQALTIQETQSVFFLCPTETEITGDAQKGVLYLQLKQVDAGDAAALTFDRGHLGGLIGLVEAQLPDQFTAKVTDGVGTTTVSDENADWINGNCTNGSTGAYVCSFNSNVFSSVAPTCFVEPVNSTSVGISSKITAVSTSSVSIEIRNNGSTPALADHSFNLTCNKAGADAKQSVQVYLNHPKISENVNEFSAKIQNNGTCSVLTENYNFIASCNRSSLGVGTVTFTADIFTQAPSIVATTGTASDDTIAIGSVSNTGFSFETNTTAGGKIDRDFFIHVSRQGADVKTPTVQPIVYGDDAVKSIGLASPVRFSATYGTTNASTVCSASPCSYLDTMGVGITSVTRSGTGTYTAVLDKTYSKVKCSIFALVNGSTVTFGGVILPECSNCSSVSFITGISNTTSAADSFGTVFCDAVE